MSEETTAFTADLYVNNKKLAFVKNDGKGGNTDYQLYKSDEAPLLKVAEAFCNNLPPTVYHDLPSKGKTLTIPMNLENYIDNLLDVHLQNKELEKFHKKMAKHQVDSILFGVPDKQYHRLKFMKPIADILRYQKGVETLLNTIQDKILPRLKKGERILNTNLPPELMALERKRIIKPLTPRKDGDDKKLGPHK